MKTYLSKLNSTERRFVVAVAMAFFLVINIFWVWPHFSDWSAVRSRLGTTTAQLATFDTAFKQSPLYETQVKKWQGDAGEVPPEDQAVQFLRAIQGQAAQSGVSVTGNGRLITRTNQFFLEQIQTITVQAGEPQLVDFLFNLGEGKSLVRVRDLSLRPDAPRQQLLANITLIASYQKNPKARPAAPAASAPAAPVPKTAPPARTDTSKPATPKIK